jgi:hypothetical protein
MASSCHQKQPEPLTEHRAEERLDIDTNEAAWIDIVVEMQARARDARLPLD